MSVNAINQDELQREVPKERLLPDCTDICSVIKELLPQFLPW